jgi:hypothetical protein
MMTGVIEHIRPPRCSASGQEVEPITVSVTETMGYWANCPECNKRLWLNSFQGPDDPFTTQTVYTFPEHIGKQEP